MFSSLFGAKKQPKTVQNRYGKRVGLRLPSDFPEKEFRLEQALHSLPLDMAKFSQLVQLYS